MNFDKQLEQLYLEGDEFFRAVALSMPSNLFSRHKHRRMTRCILANIHYANEKGDIAKWHFADLYNPLRGAKSDLESFNVTKSDRLRIIRAAVFYVETQNHYEAMSDRRDVFNSTGMFGFIMCDRLREDAKIPSFLDCPKTVAKKVHENADEVVCHTAVLCRGGTGGYTRWAMNAELALYRMLSTHVLDPNDQAWTMKAQESALQPDQTGVE